MRFINNGPEVPDRLVQAHEDGQVVFFCGAGISYPAGLPDFGGLTRSVFEDLGEDLNSVEKAAFEEKRFDVADLPGPIWSRMTVRLDRNEGGPGHAQKPVHARRDYSTSADS